MAHAKLSALGKFLKPSSKHALQLLKNKLAVVLHPFLDTTFSRISLQRAIRLATDFLMLLNVSNQQHVAVFI